MAQYLSTFANYSTFKYDEASIMVFFITQNPVTRAQVKWVI